MTAFTRICTALQPAEHVRTLTGHSGCDVSLCLAGDSYFVRKRSGSTAYNHRLHKQIEKQIALAAVIATPKVLRQGMENGLVWFDMEYVQGHGFISYAPLQSVARISEMTEQLADPLRLLGETTRETLDPSLFHSKLSALGGALSASPFHPSHAGFLNRLIDALQTCDWAGVPHSLCHGDLMVENMLMCDDGDIVFIDLLDGDLDSVWMDVAKLIQDLNSGWSLRSVLWNGRPEPAARLLRTLTKYIADEIEERMTGLFPRIGGHLDQLRALQALRVLPYVRDRAVFDNVVTGLISLAFSEDIR
jgi:hypothetical protein